MKDFKLVLRAALLSAYGIHLAVAQVGYLFQYHDPQRSYYRTDQSY